jgi:hypothetical protein
LPPEIYYEYNYDELVTGSSDKCPLHSCNWEYRYGYNVPDLIISNDNISKISISTIGLQSGIFRKKIICHFGFTKTWPLSYAKHISSKEYFIRISTCT